MPPSNDDWSSFKRDLLERLRDVDLTSRRSNKFDSPTRWLAGQWGLRTGSVVCKYVQHPKNRWNRLREALRRNPTVIVLLFEGEEAGAIAQRVSQGAVLSPRLALVVVLIRPPNDKWRFCRVLHRRGASLPTVMERGRAEFEVTEFSVPERRRRRGHTILMARPPVDLEEALMGLGLVADEAQIQQRLVVAELIAAQFGLQPDSVGFKAIPSTKNLGNRMGEALALRPSILVIVCPQLIEDRVIEEIDRFPADARAPVFMVLQGERLRVRVLEHPSVHAGLLTASAQSDLMEDPLPTVQSGVAASRRASVLIAKAATWEGWSYAEWNERLVEYTLREHDPRSGPVERIAATPEELALLAGTDPDQASVVTQTFVAACIAQLPPGVSFCGFCEDRSGRHLSANAGWTPHVVRVPPFFAILWLSCLVAYGYPDTEGGLHHRLRRLLGRSGFPRCLPSVWEEVRQWTLARRAAGDQIRELVLPPPDPYRTVVGASYFLAFPHEHDRRLIARILTDAELIGFEPPIRPVIAALQDESDRFSGLFREDLNNFTERFLDQPSDPRESAFWRAVRQEALDPSYNRGSAPHGRRLTGVLAVFDDEGLLPLLGCAANWIPPSGYSVQPLDNAIGEFEHYALSDEGLEDTARAMLETQAMLGPGPRALINQGVLIFQEDQSTELKLVSGADIGGADTALVRQDLVAAFVETFGGRMEVSRFPRWYEVDGCKVRPLDRPPEGLRTVVQLQRTMSPPTLRLVGGIRVPGGYLGFQGFLPRIRAVDAINVTVSVNGCGYACDSVGDWEWQMPAEIAGEAPCEVAVEATWRLGKSGTRTNRRVVQLQVVSVDDSYRPLNSGDYFLESCCPGQSQVRGGHPIGLGISTDDGSETCDLIECDPSLRFLGPGLGEMSFEHLPGFEWLVVGPKGRPEMLVFLGDPDGPRLPADRRSPNAGDRRHWRAALANARATCVRLPDGGYERVDEYPAVMAAMQRMSRHQTSDDPQETHATILPTLNPAPPHRTQPLDFTFALADAIAGLSVRRGGLRYRTVRQLFSELTNRNDHLLHWELIRAWTESGALDLVRNQRYNATMLVARRPRFVMVARGPMVEATLMGLVTRALAAQVRRLASQLGLTLQEVRPGCPWQPPLFRVRGERSSVDGLTTRAHLEPPEWLAWSPTGGLPSNLSADVDDQGLATGQPPDGFRCVKHWRWETAEFSRGTIPADYDVWVEQRDHRQNCSIYVVVVEGEPWLWTYVRNWALLCAYDISGRTPFRLDRRGWVLTTGYSPVHLPLPLGRLSAVLGEGVPGPILSSSRGRVEGYCYAFGSRVTDLVTDVIPDGWIKEE